MIYKDWLQEWLGSYIKTSVKGRTYDRYSQTIKLHIIPKLGDYELNDLTPITLQRFVRELSSCGNKKTGTGLSANFVNGVISILQNSLKTAYMLRYKDNYDANKIRRPKAESKRVECFTVAEQKKIEQGVAVSKKPKMFGILLCLYSGLRIGELLALEWSDVDLERGLITVSKTCHDGNVQGKHVRIFDTPKTQTSRRIIPLPKQIISRLKELKKKSSSEFVISDEQKIIYVRSYQKAFEGMLKKLNIPHRGFHALRHTFATRAIECGMDVKSLSEILGHKNPTITLNRYTHSLLEHKAEMMNRLGEML